METPFFQKGQRVRMVGLELSLWEATAVIDTLEFDPEGEIRFVFTDWKTTDGWTRYTDGGPAKISVTRKYCVEFEAHSGRVRYVTMAGDEFCVTLVE